MIPMPSRSPQDSSRPEIKYRAQQCPFLRSAVWAIQIKQPDGSWKIVNCLDKHEACFEQPCAFTRDGGLWPFEPGSSDDAAEAR